MTTINENTPFLARVIFKHQEQWCRGLLVMPPGVNGDSNFCRVTGKDGLSLVKETIGVHDLAKVEINRGLWRYAFGWRARLRRLLRRKVKQETNPVTLSA